mmetsp:Transcript_19086/g.28251  ORF Transcript_19086/g.28251 Transcript_19086/m.28251 type:complete len:408 (-) Transcript_19086:42-1265(-)
MEISTAKHGRGVWFALDYVLERLKDPETTEDDAMKFMAVLEKLTHDHNNHSMLLAPGHLDESSGIRVIVDTMTKFRRNRNVQISACLALIHLISDSEDYAKDENHEAIERAGGLQALLDAQQRHRDDETVMSHTFRAIRKLSTIHSRRSMRSMGSPSPHQHHQHQQPDTNNSNAEELDTLSCSSLSDVGGLYPQSTDSSSCYSNQHHHAPQYSQQTVVRLPMGKKHGLSFTGTNDHVKIEAIAKESLVPGLQVGMLVDAIEIPGGNLYVGMTTKELTQILKETAKVEGRLMTVKTPVPSLNRTTSQTTPVSTMSKQKVSRGGEHSSGEPMMPASFRNYSSKKQSRSSGVQFLGEQQQQQAGEAIIKDGCSVATVSRDNRSGRTYEPSSAGWVMDTSGMLLPEEEDVF